MGKVEFHVASTFPVMVAFLTLKWVFILVLIMIVSGIVKDEKRVCDEKNVFKPPGRSVLLSYIHKVRADFPQQWRGVALVT